MDVNYVKKIENVVWKYETRVGGIIHLLLLKRFLYLMYIFPGLLPI